MEPENKPPNRKKRTLLYIAGIILVLGITGALDDDNTQSKKPDPKQLSAEVAVATQLYTTPVQTRTPQVQEVKKEWVTIKSWSGEGIKNTESFEIKNREWRINWITTNEVFAVAGILQIYVHKSPNDQMVDLVANKAGVGSDASYVRGAGTFYLKINSGNVDWKVTVEDYR